MEADKIICCDVTKGIPLPDKSVHCVVTSPPYWGLRDYGVPGQLGLEKTPEEYIEKMVAVFREVWRVLRDDGSLWLNIGDSYATHASKRSGQFGKEIKVGFDDVFTRKKPTAKSIGLKEKDLCMMPARLSIALQADGWYLRSDIIWAKPNPMPESTRDRCTKSHEHLFLLTKKPKYFYDADAVREPHSDPERGKDESPESLTPHNAPKESMAIRWTAETRQYNPAGRNKRDVWTIPTQSFPEAHFACVDNLTQILTKKGWKSVDEIDWKSRIGVATYNIEKNLIEYQPIQYIKKYDYNGEMIRVGNQHLNILMTPNHRNIVRDKNGKTAIRRGDSLKERDKIQVLADVNYASRYAIGCCWAALVGWVIAEGHYKKGGFIEIYQNEGAKAQEIDRLLEEAYIPHTRNSRMRRGTEQVTWYLRKCPFVDWMYEFVPQKYLNKLLVFLPKEECEALFWALISGDGHVRKEGRVCFVQKSKKCIDWFEILALHVGWHTKTTLRSEGCYCVYCTKTTEIGTRTLIGNSIRKVQYKGIVWCPKTPNGTWIAKRDGRVFITGNTFPEKLVEPCGVTSKVTTIGWKPTCECGGEIVPPSLLGEYLKPCTVYDPFMGSGTVGLVAYKLNRRYIGTELNPEYIKMAEKRLKQEKDKYSLIES